MLVLSFVITKTVVWSIQMEMENPMLLIIHIKLSFTRIIPQYQQDMENYLMRDTDVSYNSISTLKANVLGIKNVVPVSYTHLDVYKRQV